MAKFNWKSIDAKIKSAQSKAFASKSGEVREMAINAADEFIKVLNNLIKNAKFSEGQSPAISSWSRGEPYVTNDTASITVSLPSHMGTSLYDRKSEGPIPVDLAEIFIHGHNPEGYVYGEWKGVYIRSSRNLTYRDFVGEAIDAFNGHAGDGYTVTDINRS